MRIRSASHGCDSMIHPCTPANWMDVLLALVEQGFQYLFVEVEADEPTRLATGGSTHTLMKCVRSIERPCPPPACPAFGHDYGFDTL